MNSLPLKGFFRVLLAFTFPVSAIAQVTTGVADLLIDQEAFTDSLSVLYPVDEWAAETPWGPGEHLVYQVKVGIFNAGEGHMTVEALDSIRGHQTYRAVMGIKGGLPGLRVDDSYTTWIDVQTLQSWRYIREIDEPFYESYRHYEFYPDRRVWHRTDNDESGPLASSLPLDDIAFIYFIRRLPLEVGKTYSFSRYFKEDGNPVVIQVLRQDEYETEGVRYSTIVVKPIVQTDGLFGQGGEAELHFTDDDRRILVYMKSNIPLFPGSLTLHLKSIQEGVPLNPESRDTAREGRLNRAALEPDTIVRR